MTAFGLDDAEARAVADRFAVAIEQVRRDHLISHILAALSTSHAEQVVFFGGTALARTHLPAGRLSEDIDLIATGIMGSQADGYSRHQRCGASRPRRAANGADPTA